MSALDIDLLSICFNFNADYLAQARLRLNLNESGLGSRHFKIENTARTQRASSLMYALWRK